jgi:6-phosphogluconolactonase
MNPNPPYTLEVFKTVAELDSATARHIITIAKDAVKERSRFSISLSGGDTPKKLYALLAEEPYNSQMPWQETHIFWGDERCLPLEDVRNNAHEAKLILLDKIKLPAENIHVIPVNRHPAEAADAYEKELAVFFNGQPMRFDLILLGLGENGHTASLFPGTNVLQEQAAGVRAVYVEGQQMFRITLTAPLINAAANIVFLVSGESKSQILKNVLSSDDKMMHYPAQLIKPAHGKLFWLVDEAAARLIQHLVFKIISPL